MTCFWTSLCYKPLVSGFSFRYPASKNSYIKKSKLILRTLKQEREKLFSPISYFFIFYFFFMPALEPELGARDKNLRLWDRQLIIALLLSHCRLSRSEQFVACPALLKTQCDNATNLWCRARARLTCWTATPSPRTRPSRPSPRPAAGRYWMSSTIGTVSSNWANRDFFLQLFCSVVDPITLNWDPG